MDSVGIENRGGKIFVVHIVDQKETLYGLARRYQSAVDEIIKHNPDTKEGLKIGQRIVIPYTVNVEGGVLVHTVKAGETLSSISRKYGVGYKDVKQWNGLEEESLSIGQKVKIRIQEKNEKEKVAIKQENSVDTTSVDTRGGRKVHIVQMQQTLFSIGRSYGVSVDELMKMNNLQSADIKPGQELVVGIVEGNASNNSKEEVDTNTSEVVTVADTPDTPDVDKEIETRDTEKEDKKVGDSKILVVKKPREFKEVEASGLAEAIDGTEDTRKYLALHRTAKVGTILRVRNEMNNQEVFVRVLGKLPDTGVNNGLLIKISKAAYNRLGAIDRRFRVHVSYIP